MMAAISRMSEEMIGHLMGRPSIRTRWRVLFQ
jgi:hypothetical protein